MISTVARFGDSPVSVTVTVALIGVPANSALRAREMFAWCTASCCAVAEALRIRSSNSGLRGRLACVGTQ